ncbi:hypothetical protein A1O1_01627 [Capronia coronata CBS 617.96]|uniref:Zn(2)-C6 fungal-type domain-containing protein n=1 Tax=Capronia coronata CBS 617.96 TaxID=1182541 RepID=W9Z4H3_9EURO|nr:uncharacterized protein A1O1_01627 [Capronia coronata CBS 617.96]EXJ96501.1 hypothetical protein A1O1_01627 [Capronia coronata CBS 617.96]
MAPVSRNVAEKELALSPEAGARGFVAVNHASSNDSAASSQLSSPQDNPRRGSEFSSRTPSSIYPHNQSKEGSSHKRKRSDSDEQERYNEQPPYEYNPSQRPEPQHMANRALHVLGNADQNGGGYYQNGNTSNQNGHTWQPERAGQASGSANGVRPGSPDAHLAEILQQEGSGPDAQRSWDPSPSSNGEAATVGSKRKRNFSNRTKTGCLTCRARKKKCDEQHPTCANCIRGGFECKGYTRTSRRNIWPANGGPARPVMPLQSKDAPSDVSDPQTRSGTNIEASSTNVAPPYDSGHIRSGPVDDPDGQRQQQYATSPSQSEPRGQPSYPGRPQQQWTQQPASSSYTSEHLPPLSELGRSEQSFGGQPRDIPRPPTQGSVHSQHSAPPLSQPPSHMSPQRTTTQAGPANLPHPQPPPHPHPPPPPPPPPHHPPSAGAPQQTTHWLPPQPPEYRPAYVSAPVEHHDSSGRGHVRMASASFDNPKSGAKTFTKEDVERSKMLRCTSYNHHDPTLVNERQRCKQALARYNQACALDNAASEDEIRAKLLKVFDPSKDTTHKFISHPLEKGMIGHGSKIEAPFKCTYGYNIKIMEDVFIGENCEIDDCGKVDIGPRTFIGSGVTIFTQNVGKDLVDRKGTGAPWMAQQVSIASEVIIGKGAVIYPGVTIGRGATVEPFAIVRDALGEFQTQFAAVGHRA